MISYNINTILSNAFGANILHFCENSVARFSNKFFNSSSFKMMESEIRHKYDKPDQSNMKLLDKIMTLHTFKRTK